MSDRRLFLILTFSIIGAFSIIACLLIFLRIGGSAQFQVFGQSFSSTNIGLAVLFIAAIILVYAIREVAPSETSALLLGSSASGESISWEETISGVDDLVLQLTAADGFRPDIVIGICGGGLMVADLVAKRLGHIPCLAIWSDRHAHRTGSSFDGNALFVNGIALDDLFVAKNVERVLVVDDVSYSGKTLSDAVAFLRGRSQMLDSRSVDMRTAVLFMLTSSVIRPDFSVYEHSKRRRMMPSSDRLR